MSERIALEIERAGVPALFVAIAFSGLISCERAPADYNALRAENHRLKAQLERLSHSSEQSSKRGAEMEKAVELSIKDLWSQRFEDTRLRAKTNLDQKLLRVTGNIDSVHDRSVSLYGNATRFGRESLQVQLDDDYAANVQDGLAALTKGVPVTVQGRFVFESNWLTRAKFVDSKSGKQLSSSDLAELAVGIESNATGDPARHKQSSSESKTGVHVRSGSE
jgi:hypothetical protein